MGTYQEAVEQAYKQRQMADIQRASKLGLNTRCIARGTKLRSTAGPK